MDRVNLEYSTKNIPIPPRKTYLNCLIKQTEKFLRSIRWRAFFYLNPDIRTANKDSYGFKSTKSPPAVPELKEFEDNILEIIQNIRFSKYKNQFQHKLTQDIKKIKDSDKLLIAADKTTNFYQVDANDYNRLLEENIMKSYKKDSMASVDQITKGDKSIASDLDLDDRIDTTARNNAFITLKDHKPNFNNRPTCRLINPSKSEIGRISKIIIENINKAIMNKSKLNQWKNTNDVIQWYNKLTDKKQSSFICFDICEFYPSITEELLHKAIRFAESFTTINEQQKSIIIHAKKSLLYNNGTPWCKRNNRDHFDVTMGSFDGAETCELIGLMILHDLNNIPGINVGLYRDDGLAVCKGTPRTTELTKKKICQVFNKLQLKITAEANKKIIDFLDITLDLTTGGYKPFMKVNNTPLYVNKESNHPPIIIRNIPESIAIRLNAISSSKEELIKSVKPYQDALKKSGYNYNILYRQENKKSMNRTRARKITWFNPPYSSNVNTNLGKRFIYALEKCFPKQHPLSKIINKNTVKLSYCCMPNIGNIISSHNKSLMSINTYESNSNNSERKKCNCKRGNTCPLDNNCLVKSVIYQATVKRKDNNECATYIGQTENSFKQRYNGHTSTFRNANQMNSTTLSSHVWKLKNLGVPYDITWKILTQAKAYNTKSKNCNLCIQEKYYIIYKAELGTLNNRNELISCCRHRRKHLLSSF